MKNATKGQVDRAAQKHGATVTDNSGEFVYDIEVEAPPGQVFKATTTHAVVASGNDSYAKGELWGALLDDIRGGFEKCETEDCEWCEDTVL